MPLMVLSDATSLFSTLPLTEVIKSASWLMATSPPQGEGRAVADACSHRQGRNFDLINLFKQGNCLGQSARRTNIHLRNQCEENVLFLEKRTSMEGKTI